MNKQTGKSSEKKSSSCLAEASKTVPESYVFTIEDAAEFYASLDFDFDTGRIVQKEECYGRTLSAIDLFDVDDDVVQSVNALIGELPMSAVNPSDENKDAYNQFVASLKGLRTSIEEAMAAGAALKAKREKEKAQTEAKQKQILESSATTRSDSAEPDINPFAPKTKETKD